MANGLFVFCLESKFIWNSRIFDRTINVVRTVVVKFPISSFSKFEFRGFFFFFFFTNCVFFNVPNSYKTKQKQRSRKKNRRDGQCMPQLNFIAEVLFICLEIAFSLRKISKFSISNWTAYGKRNVHEFNLKKKTITNKSIASASEVVNLSWVKWIAGTFPLVGFFFVCFPVFAATIQAIG